MMLSASSSGVKTAADSSPAAIPSSAVAENAEDHDKSREISSVAETSVLGNPTQLLNFETLISPEKSTHKNHHSCDDDSSVALARRVSSPCSSAFVVGNNQDLLSQILLFLPAKSLMRFQCVSKDWLAIISNPNFRRLHSRRSPGAEPGLLLLRQVQGKSEVNPVPLGKTELTLTSVSMMAARFDNLFNIEGEILGMHSCKGLFCIDFLPKNASRRFFVFNPITNQSRRIPWIDIGEKMDRILAVNICYDPLESDHYRLVCVWEKNIGEENIGDREFRFTVYSSETGVWKHCEWCAAVCWHYYFQDGVFWNGIHCWTSKEWVILYFDFERECVAIMSMWDDYVIGGPGNGAILYFGESGGNLWLIATVGISLEIWQLKGEFRAEYGSYLYEWTPKYSLGLSFFRALGPSVASHMFCNFDKHFSFYKPMQFGFRVPSFVVDGREEKPKIVISVPGKIVRYDIKDKTVEELVEIEPADLQYFELIMSSFALNEAYKLVETLACV